MLLKLKVRNEGILILCKFIKQNSEIIEYSDTVSPICISDEKVELSGWGYIAGWGITKEKGFQSHELLEATLPIFDTNKCNMRYGGKIDAETQFCAGYSKLKS